MPVIQSNAKIKQPHKPFPIAVVVVVAAVVLMLCAGVLSIGMFNGNESMRRALTGNRLKQILIALHAYNAVYDRLPPAVVTDADGKPLYSGRVLLLPFLEDDSLYKRFDKSKAWNSPENLPLAQREVSVFQSPKHRAKGGSYHFVFVSGTGTAFDGVKSIRLAEVVDGLSETLLVVETKQGPSSWAEPIDWNANSGALLPGFHGNTTYVGLGDGRVLRLTTQPPHPHSKSLCTIAGGEQIPQSAFAAD